MKSRPARPAFRALALAVASLCFAGAAMAVDPADDKAIADSLAAMLRAGRNVISANQARINDPALGDKGLDGKSVLDEAITMYRIATGSDPLAIDPASRQGMLLRAEMNAIVAVMDAAKPELDAKGIGFKGFIPAVFGRLVSEEFGRRAQGAATMKVTAPLDRVRNRAARPDTFETAVIRDKFLAAGWVPGTPFAATVQQDGAGAFRVMVPEYYAASCLSCHGAPKGSLDVTGYPREGFAEGDLGGVISITLRH